MEHNKNFIFMIWGQIHHLRRATTNKVHESIFNLICNIAPLIINLDLKSLKYSFTVFNGPKIRKILLFIILVILFFQQHKFLGLPYLKNGAGGKCPMFLLILHQCNSLPDKKHQPSEIISWGNYLKYFEIV